MSALKHEVAKIEGLSVQFDDLDVLFDLVSEDDTAEQEINLMLNEIELVLSDLETGTLLSGKYDNCSVIVSLNAGAGGTDAQDWTQILYRMYTRWFDSKGFKVDVVDEAFGDEAGLKSVTMLVSGPYAYGLIKNEVGVHRLVRLSPFNANNKRQTSFAALEAVPELNLDLSNYSVDPKELKIDTFRASGAGGQHVNKTDSAVRITHLPTGIVAQSQSSRSQGANKETAMKILMSRLGALLETQHKESIQDLKGVSADIAWGNQIRSYVFHPYKLVKDLRTQVETSDVSAILDGDLDRFITAHLRLKASPDRMSKS